MPPHPCKFYSHIETHPPQAIGYTRKRKSKSRDRDKISGKYVPKRPYFACRILGCCNVHHGDRGKSRMREPRRRKRKKSRGVTCLLSSERAAFGQSGLSTSWLAQDGRAAGADDNCLCVRVDGGDGEAAGALDIHEERSGSRDKVL
jgi:hypothetical protein